MESNTVPESVMKRLIENEKEISVSMLVPEEIANKGLRFNEGKLRFDLIPPEADLALAEILTMGAKKYAARNWELGMEWMKMVASLKRHLNEWEHGNDKDAESGYNHMKHVLWNAMALVTYIERNIGTDDRPSKNV